MSAQLEAAVQAAYDHGFSHAGPLDVATLKCLPEVRDMCAAGRCNKYGHCWTCPPGCGTLEENEAAMHRYSAGILVQTTRELEDDFDYENIEMCAKLQQEHLTALSDALRPLYPGMLVLGAGGCTRCKTCTYPDAPCRFPDKALSSMEAYGLFVSDVCTKNGLGYYYGPGTITYTGCILLW